MRKLILAAVMVVGVCGVAFGRQLPTTPDEFSAFAFDSAECAAFYLVFNNCAPSDHAKKLSEQMLLTSITISDEELALSRVELNVKSIIKEVGNCGRLAVAVNKYGEKCKDLFETLDKF